MRGPLWWCACAPHPRPVSAIRHRILLFGTARFWAELWDGALFQELHIASDIAGFFLSVANDGAHFSVSGFRNFERVERCIQLFGIQAPRYIFATIG